MIELVRLSGYRLRDVPPHLAPTRWAALRAEVEKYLPLMQNMVPGYYFDDTSINVPLIDRIMGKLQDGEVFFAFSGKARTLQNFVGFAALTNIQYGRSAYLEGIANGAFYSPLNIGKAMGEIIVYAFKPYHELTGLGLWKIKAGVVEGNMRVVRMLAKQGFLPAARFKFDILQGGVPRDTIVLERLNPLYFGEPAQVISNGISSERTEIPADKLCGGTGSGDVRGGDTSTVYSEPERPEGGTAGPANDGGGAELVEPEQLRRHGQPVFSEREGWTLRPEPDTADEQLVHAEPSGASSGSGTVGGSGFGAKLRQLWPGNGRAN